MAEAPSSPRSAAPGVSPRLSDRLLYALDLAISQQDVVISDLLVRALELALTRNTGGPDFVERRGFPPELEDALDRVSQMRAGPS